MKTAKIFINGRSQAIRLPKAYRFDGNEVFIKKIPGGVLLIPKDLSIWDVWEKNLMKYNEPFMTERNQQRLNEFILPFEILNYDSTAARVYGDTRFQLEKSGKSIGSLDLFIGTHAMSQNLILVTNNVKEFKRIKNLKVENWTK